MATPNHKQDQAVNDLKDFSMDGYSTQPMILELMNPYSYEPKKRDLPLKLFELGFFSDPTEFLSREATDFLHIPVVRNIPPSFAHSFARFSSPSSHLGSCLVNRCFWFFSHPYRLILLKISSTRLNRSFDCSIISSIRLALSSLVSFCIKGIKRPLS